jgi:hypothetical protein
MVKLFVSNKDHQTKQNDKTPKYEQDSDLIIQLCDIITLLNIGLMGNLVGIAWNFGLKNFRESLRK